MGRFNTFLAVFSALNLLSATSPAVALASSVNNLTQKIFGDEKNDRCQIIDTKPRPDLTKLDSGLQNLFDELESAIEANEPKRLRNLFHQRITKAAEISDQMLLAFEAKYQRPWDVSNYRVIALHSSQEDKSPISCYDNTIIITPLFGYKLQFGFWLQILAQNELSRAFIIAVPEKDKWVIGGLHIQQWTHQGHDFEYWIKQAETAPTPVWGHINYDISQKLLFGGSFLEFPIKEKIIAARDARISKQGWLQEAQNLPDLKADKPLYIGTALTAEGPGLVTRGQVPKELTLDEFFSLCQRYGKAYQHAGWLKPNSGGLECQFLLPNESQDKPGILGSRYLSISEINKS